MTFEYRKIEGAGGDALWYGDLVSDYPDFEIPDTFGPSQGRLYCPEGEFNVKGSIDGVNFLDLYTLTAGEAVIVPSRVLYIRCEPQNASNNILWYSHRYVRRDKTRLNPRGIYTQKISVVINGVNYTLNAIEPELVADFENNYYRKGGVETTFEDLFTHSRASTATYFDSNGHMQTALSGVARKLNHIYNGTSWMPAGYLHEPSVTNMIANSEDITGWLGLQKTLTANQGVGPDGTLSLAKFADDNGAPASEGYVYAYSPGITVAFTTTYVFSIYAKADQLDWLIIEPSGFTTPTNTRSFYDLTNGVVGSKGSSHDAIGMEDLGNGLYRCWVRITTGGTDNTGVIRIYVSDGNGDRQVQRDGTSSIFVGKPQFEEGYFPSSYIPTSGSSVTRAADTLSIAGVNVPFSATGLSYTFNGLLTYTDLDTTQQIIFMDQTIDNSNYARITMSTTTTRTGTIHGLHRIGGATTQILLDEDVYTPGQNIEVRAAMRMSDSEVNIAGRDTVDTAGTTTGLVNLSGVDMNVCGAGFTGNIKTIRVYGADVGDVGLTEFVT